MNIKIKFTNLPKSPAIEDYVFKKLSSLSKFLKDRDNTLVEIELAKTTGHHKSGEIFKAEANVSCEGRQFYVLAEKDDLYAAVDKMRDEVEREIVSSRKKYLTVFRHGSGRIKNLIKRLYR